MLSSTSADSNDGLASLLATAAVALDTDRRAAKSCIQRAAALLGIDLSSEGDGTAGPSCRHGGLAPWQAKHIRSFIEDKLDASIRISDLAGVVRLSPPNNPDMNRAFIVGMFHELHCLRYLRDEFASATKPARDRKGKEPAWGHVQHCLNLLRRAVLCGADTTLERADAEYDVFAQREGIDEHALGRVGAYHVCRDWSTVYEEMTRSWIRWWDYGKEHNIIGGSHNQLSGA